MQEISLWIRKIAVAKDGKYCYYALLINHDMIRIYLTGKRRRLPQQQQQRLWRWWCRWRRWWQQQINLNHKHNIMCRKGTKKRQTNAKWPFIIIVFLLLLLLCCNYAFFFSSLEFFYCSIAFMLLFLFWFIVVLSLRVTYHEWRWAAHSRCTFSQANIFPLNKKVFKMLLLLCCIPAHRWRPLQLHTIN